MMATAGSANGPNLSKAVWVDQIVKGGLLTLRVMAKPSEAQSGVFQLVVERWEAAGNRSYTSQGGTVPSDPGAGAATVTLSSSTISASKNSHWTITLIYITDSGKKFTSTYYTNPPNH